MKLMGGLALVTVAAIATGLAASVPADTLPAPKKATTTARPTKATAPTPLRAAARHDDLLVIKRVLTIDGPFRHGDWMWDDRGVPAGPLIITVDLKAQTLSVFRDGYEIGAAVIAYGADEMPTPLGVFPILQKDADHWSSLYDAPMPYTLRLTNDGVAIHGSEVARDKATHGCIGIPKAFAKLLFAQAKLGDRVVVTNGRPINLSGTQSSGA